MPKWGMPAWIRSSSGARAEKKAELARQSAAQISTPGEKNPQTEKHEAAFARPSRPSSAFARPNSAPAAPAGTASYAEASPLRKQEREETSLPAGKTAPAARLAEEQNSAQSTPPVAVSLSQTDISDSPDSSRTSLPLKTSPATSASPTSSARPTGRGWRERLKKPNWAARVPRLVVESESGEGSGGFMAGWKKLTANPSFNLYTLVCVVALLSVIGILMQYSSTVIIELSRDANPYLGWLKPLGFTAVSVLALLLAALVPARYYTSRSAWAFFGAAILLQLSVFTPLGISQYGNTNWIRIPGVGFTFQPSEVLKLGFIIILCWVFSHRVVDYERARSVWLWAFGPYFVCVAIVMLGNDMGTVMVFTLIAFSLYLVAGVKFKHWGGLLGLLLLGAAFLVLISASRRARIWNFLVGIVGDRHEDPLGVGLQTVRAKWALGSGGLTGLGAGASRQKWLFLPEAHTDFIFAILGEEFGFIGTLTVLFLFCVLGYVLARIVRTSSYLSTRLFAVGLFGWIIFQALINVGVVVGILPVLGLPLPFISSGGSSMLASYAACGVLISLLNRERERVPGSRVLAWFNRRSASVQSRDQRVESKRKFFSRGGNNA